MHARIHSTELTKCTSNIMSLRPLKQVWLLGLVLLLAFMSYLYLFLVTCTYIHMCARSWSRPSALWQNSKSVRLWTIPRSCIVFHNKYDDIQEQLQTTSCMDDLLSSKFAVDLLMLLLISAKLWITLSSVMSKMCFLEVYNSINTRRIQSACRWSKLIQTTSRCRTYIFFF